MRRYEGAIKKTLQSPKENVTNKIVGKRGKF
jgi:hypothetical protein